MLANSLIYEWWKTFDYTTTSTPLQHADVYYPIPLKLEWQVDEAAQYYLVYLSTDKGMSAPKSYVTNKSSIFVEELFVGTTYYWQVDAVYADKTLRSEVFSFNTVNSPRAVEIEGVSNTRDIGGMLAADGYRIKQGMIYRGGKLEGITEAGRQKFLYELGIKTDLDLRTPGEGGAGTKSPVSDDLNYVNIDGRYYTGDKGISTSLGKELFAQEIRLFADPNNYPIYIHCSLGRDRTGTLAMVIEGLLGVDKNTLMMDYELSMFSVTGTLDNANPLSSIKETYDYINNNYSGETFAEKTENYLLSIGITAEEIASIRSILLEEVK